MEFGRYLVENGESGSAVILWLLAGIVINSLFSKDKAILWTKNASTIKFVDKVR